MRFFKSPDSLSSVPITMTTNAWTPSIQSREEQREMKRMAILRTAARMFNQAGFKQTSLAGLAEALNVTKPTLYYYVKNKDDILNGILELAMTELRAVAAEPAKGRNGYDQLKRYVERYAAVMTDDFGASLIMTRISAMDTRFADTYRQASREVLGAVRLLITQGIVDQSIADCNPKYAASALLGTLNETVYWYLVDGKESPQDTLKEFMMFFEQGFLPR